MPVSQLGPAGAADLDGQPVLEAQPQSRLDAQGVQLETAADAQAGQRLPRPQVLRPCARHLKSWLCLKRACHLNPPGC